MKGSDKIVKNITYSTYQSGLQLQTILTGYVKTTNVLVFLYQHRIRAGFNIV